MEEVSKQTVKNKLHNLKFPKEKERSVKEKKVVDYLYIDADEDHVPLQFKEKKVCILYCKQINIFQIGNIFFN